MQATETRPVVDLSLVRLAQRGMADESLSTSNGSFAIYRVGRAILGLRDELSDMPEIVLFHRFGSSDDASEAIGYLRSAARNNRNQTDSPEINTESVELRVASGE